MKTLESRMKQWPAVQIGKYNDSNQHYWVISCDDLSHLLMAVRKFEAILNNIMVISSINGRTTFFLIPRQPMNRKKIKIG